MIFELVSIVIESVTSLWPGPSECWSVSLQWFPKRAVSYSSMLVSEFLFNYFYIRKQKSFLHW